MKSRLMLAAAACVAALAASDDASACGGCFSVGIGPKTENTVVTGHRMALAVSPTQTVLWDQIQYSGNPSEFAWVLPVKPGAVIEASTDAWFETLEAGTLEHVTAPGLSCPGPPPAGCASSFASADFAGGESNNSVTVLHEGSVGPYDTVTLSSKDPAALTDWLTKHGYAVPSDVQPIIDAYVKESFDFIALRLQPGKGVRQMKPVRVVSPGASPVLPLRMVAAGTGANVSIILYFIGEGRWETRNFPNGQIPVDQLTWDYVAQESNYSALRTSALAQNGGLTWITPFARHGALLSPIPSTSFGDFAASTLATTYFQQATKNGETGGADCMPAEQAAANDASSSALVVTNQKVPPTQIDAKTLACGAADDLAVALTGMHPADVWLTRLESSLPHAALANDLELQASAQQLEVDSSLIPKVLTRQDEECRILNDKQAASYKPAHASVDLLSLAGAAGVLALLRWLGKKR